MTAAPALTKTLKIKLTVASGDSAGRSHFFEKPIIAIGRGPENDLVFPNDPKMSRVHVEVRQQSGQVLIRNVSQRNILLVNKERVEEKILNGPATIQIGETLLQVQVEEPEQATKVSLAAQSSTPQSFSSQSPVASSVAPAIRKNTTSQAYPASTGGPGGLGPAYASQPPPPPPRKRSVAAARGDGSRLRFYLIVVAVVGLGYWLLSSGTGGRKPEVRLRTEGDVARAIEESAEAVQEIKKEQSQAGQGSLQYRAAQEHYIKGFRDYRQGQYARAMQSFQAALSFYPNHELARKYLFQAQRKFEAQIDLSMAQGRKYHQKQNYRMCQSAFANVMIMVKDSSKPKYKEAKQFYDECSLRVEGKY